MTGKLHTELQQGAIKAIGINTGLFAKEALSEFNEKGSVHKKSFEQVQTELV